MTPPPPQQPAAPPAPPSRSRKAGIVKIVVIAGVAIALGVGAVSWFAGRDDVDRAEVGDCLANEGNTIFPDLRVVGCGDEEARFKVVRVVPDTMDTSRCEGLTDVAFNEELDRNRHRSGKQYVLCLDGIKR
ncbi:LppU/SCO3897 family protein [Streptomyces erythrochromogenes]|uniref:LppU/SCO3897 family protein n=1 Tax=Streptomyces erythrochromogenes TaxID=285574 RepID=UPI003827D7E9